MPVMTAGIPLRQWSLAKGHTQAAGDIAAENESEDDGRYNGQYHRRRSQSIAYIFDTEISTSMPIWHRMTQTQIAGLPRAGPPKPP